MKVNDVSEEQLAFIFRVEEEGRQEAMMVLSSAYSITLKMEAMCSSEI
jgi:hypothetical protein